MRGSGTEPPHTPAEGAPRPTRTAHARRQDVTHPPKMPAVRLRQREQAQDSCRGLWHGHSPYQGSYGSCGTSKHVLFMSPWATHPLPSCQRATDRQVLRVFGGCGRGSKETGRRRPSAV